MFWGGKVAVVESDAGSWERLAWYLVCEGFYEGDGPLESEEVEKSFRGLEVLPFLRTILWLGEL